MTKIFSATIIQNFVGLDHFPDSYVELYQPLEKGTHVHVRVD